MRASVWTLCIPYPWVTPLFLGMRGSVRTLCIPYPLVTPLFPELSHNSNENCSEEILWLFWCAMQKGFNLGGLWGIT